MKSSIKRAIIVLTAATLSLAILTEVKPAKSQSTPLPDTEQQSPQQLPEPGTMLGLLLSVLGGFFVKKQIAETDAPGSRPEEPNESKVETTEINSENNSEQK
ncbi:MAG: PEP-CTERM sorting domain-containing protein [Cyanobacteriota bacterium]|nr:PEP-CTERM sorting domain-containing protein [Cyanobacteriota bacterium]